MVIFQHWWWALNPKSLYITTDLYHIFWPNAWSYYPPLSMWVPPTFLYHPPTDLRTLFWQNTAWATLFVSWQMYDEMKRVDKLLGEFIQQLEDHAIRNKTNIVIVGDHGMETGKGKEWVHVSDYLPTNSVSYVSSSGAYLQIQPHKGRLNDV